MGVEMPGESREGLVIKQVWFILAFFSAFNNDVLINLEVFHILVTGALDCSLQTGLFRCGFV